MSSKIKSDSNDRHGLYLPKRFARILFTDRCICPSIVAGCVPNAVLEAMACGNRHCHPVGGVTDVIEDGVNGMLVQVNDVNGLAEKIAEALSQPEKREQLGRSAREAVLRRYTLENELQANLKVYESLGVK
jgi:glycosyltransferase involved in cell wall biosynthesis